MQVAASQPPGQARTTATRTALRSPAALVLVTGEPVAGVLLVELVGARLELALLAVHPGSQRQGLGRSLVAAVLARYPSVVAWSASPEVCEALGLVPTGEVRDGLVELAAPVRPTTPGPA